MKVSLAVLNGPAQGRVIEFVEPRHYLFGRAPDMDFVLPNDDKFVSRRHVMIEVAPPNARLIDLHSTNPPHLNGKEVDTANLADGDELELGYTRFSVTIDPTLETRKGRCRGCGGAVTLMGQDPEPRRCAACLDARVSAAVARRRVHICSHCGKDLDAIANADGRAEELGEDVHYCCEGCRPAGDEHAGKVHGSYTLVKHLGGGGMGDVFLAWQSSTARLVAIKIVRDLQEPEAVRRFVERERVLTAELRHPSLVRYIDQGVGQDGAPFFVMQYLPDGSLDALITPEGPVLNPSEAVDMICSALEGLAHMHEREVLHRDIKPANILLDRRRAGERGFARIADLGLAVCYSKYGGLRFTKEGAAMGTAIFMAPEQARNAREVREPADTYSMGVTLYYLLTGSYPLDFPSRRDLYKLAANDPRFRGLDFRNPDPRMLRKLGYELSLNLVVDEDVKPIPVRKRRAELPRKLAEVVDQAVLKREKDRFGSAIDMRDALLAALA